MVNISSAIQNGSMFFARQAKDIAIYLKSYHKSSAIFILSNKQNNDFVVFLPTLESVLYKI